MSFTNLLSAGEKNEGISGLSKGNTDTAVYDKGSNGTVISTNTREATVWDDAAGVHQVHERRIV